LIVGYDSKKKNVFSPHKHFQLLFEQMAQRTRTEEEEDIVGGQKMFLLKLSEYYARQWMSPKIEGLFRPGKSFYMKEPGKNRPSA